MTWTVMVEQDEDGSLVIPLPDELLAQLGVGIGDSLYLVEENVATTRCLLLSKTPQVPDRIDALVEQFENEQLKRFDQLTKEALADVDAGRVHDHQTIQTWAYALVSSQCELPMEALHPPINEADYDRLAKVLDELLVVVGEDENHPLTGLAARIADWIEAYDEALPRLPE